MRLNPFPAFVLAKECGYDVNQESNSGCHIL
jgi:hypothetical protein